MTYFLSEQQLLEIWEQGQEANNIQRARLLLSHQVTDDELSKLTLGQRNSHLLRLRQQVIGDKLECLSHCPACQETVEFATTIDAVYQPVDKAHKLSACQTWQYQTMSMEFRCITSDDLLTIIKAKTLKQATEILLSRCLLGVKKSGQTISHAELNDEIVDELFNHIANIDSNSDIVFNLHCPACEQGWQAAFDVVQFIWQEISVRAKNYLHDIHTLAYAYGWSEHEINQLSTLRRQYYLASLRV